MQPYEDKSNVLGEEQEMATIRKSKLQNDVDYDNEEKEEDDDDDDDEDDDDDDDDDDNNEDYQETMNEKVDKIMEEQTHMPTYSEVWLITLSIFFIATIICLLIFLPKISSTDDFCKEKYGNYSWSENSGQINPDYFMCKNIDENNTIIEKYRTFEEYNQWKKTKTK